VTFLHISSKRGLSSKTGKEARGEKAPVTRIIHRGREGEAALVPPQSQVKKSTRKGEEPHPSSHKKATLTRGKKSFKSLKKKEKPEGENALPSGR